MQLSFMRCILSPDLRRQFQQRQGSINLPKYDRALLRLVMSVEAWGGKAVVATSSGSRYAAVTHSHSWSHGGGCERSSRLYIVPVGSWERDEGTRSTRLLTLLSRILHIRTISSL